LADLAGGSILGGEMGKTPAQWRDRVVAGTKFSSKSERQKNTPKNFLVRSGKLVRRQKFRLEYICLPSGQKNLVSRIEKNWNVGDRLLLGVLPAS
jgi:hypothetical protein